MRGSKADSQGNPLNTMILFLGEEPVPAETRPAARRGSAVAFSWLVKACQVAEAKAS